MTEFLSANALPIALIGALGCWAGVFTFLWRTDSSLKKLERHIEQQD